MKTKIIISAIAITFSLVSLNAETPQNIEKSTNYELITVSNVSPFCMSIVKGDYETVKKLIGLGADVNAKSNGMTPAMYAAKFNKVEILKLLISHGADLKTRSDNGQTAIKYAELSNAKEAAAFIKETLKNA